MPYNISQVLLSRQTAAVSPESNPDEYLTVLNYSGSLKNTVDTIFKAPWVAVKGWCFGTEVCFLKPIKPHWVEQFEQYFADTPRDTRYTRILSRCAQNFLLRFPLKSPTVLHISMVGQHDWAEREWQRQLWLCQLSVSLCPLFQNSKQWWDTINKEV